MQNCKSINIVPMVYECYFFNQLLHCIGRYLHYNVLLENSNDDVSFTRSKRVNEEIILRYTSSRKTSSHAKFQAQCLHGLPVLT